jgi:hypothetical protein
MNNLAFSNIRAMKWCHLSRALHRGYHYSEIARCCRQLIRT